MRPTSLMKLGKRPARHDPRTLRLAKYVRNLPPPPASVDWTQRLGAMGSMLNDSLGDCTCAGMGHLLQAWTGNASGTPIVVSDQAVLDAYEGSCGYNPADPSTDRGGIEIEVLKYFRTIGLAGHQISAFAAVNVMDQREIMTALNLFGGLYTGVALPVSAQAQVGGLWDVDGTPAGNPGTWGGHCVPILAANAAGLTCATWGNLQTMTWAFWWRYFDEAYAVLSPDWISPSALSPSGFDLASLNTDLLEVSG